MLHNEDNHRKCYTKIFQWHYIPWMIGESDWNLLPSCDWIIFSCTTQQQIFNLFHVIDYKTICCIPAKQMKLKITHNMLTKMIVDSSYRFYIHGLTLIPNPQKCRMELLLFFQLQRLHRWRLIIYNSFYPALHNGCNYLSMLGSRLIHDSERGPRAKCRLWNINTRLDTMVNDAWLLW